MAALESESNGRGDEQRHRGPSLLAVAIVYAVLFVASLIAMAALTGGEHFPSPFEPPASTSGFFSDHAAAVQVSAFLQFGAAMPLAIFSAAAASRLQFLGVRAAGPSIALVGGTLASAMTLLSGLVQWVLSQAGIATSDGALRALHLLAFASGGPGFVVPFGILVAGIAVSGGLPGHLPRWVMWFGLVIAAIAELSSLSILTPAAAYLLPAARFLGLIWLIVVGATLPSTRGSRTAATAGPAFHPLAGVPQP